MTSDLGVWRAANIIMKRYGKDAAIVASQRADELLAKGDVEGQIMWQRIVLAIVEWEKGKPEGKPS